MDKIRQILLKEDEEALPPISPGWIAKAKRKVIHFLSLDENHPQCLGFFPSRLSARKEKRSQFFSKNRYIIHPFSKFCLYYDMFLLLLYSSLFIFKGIDFGFLDIGTHISMVRVIIFLDIVSLIDIIIQFRIGYSVRETKTIELRGSRIALRYLKSPYFISDLLSSIPKHALCFFITEKCNSPIGFVILNSFVPLRLIRVPTFIRLLAKVADYWKIGSRNLLFALTYSNIMLLFTHWMACLHFAVPRYMYYLWGSYSPSSWVIKYKLLNQRLITKYSHAWFKSCGFSLGVYLKEYILLNWEEIVAAILHYVFGRMLVIITWLVLATSILSSRSLTIKYQEILNQLKEYMTYRQLPADLQEQMLQYYKFKYKGKYFSKSSIQRTLSENLKQEIKVFSRKRFVSNTSLFKHLPHTAITYILNSLELEIYMPNDVIIQSGTVGNAMFFILEGTVTVKGRSGREISHLQDGAYFGEIALLISGQPRSASVVAIEICSILKLEKKYFDRCFIKNSKAFTTMFEEATRRLSVTKGLDEDYRQWLFQRSYTKTNL